MTITVECCTCSELFEIPAKDCLWYEQRHQLPFGWECKDCRRAYYIHLAQLTDEEIADW